MKTNCQGLLVIEKHYLAHGGEIKWGLLDEREINIITEELNLKEKDLIQLRDARDFVIVYITNAIMTQQLNGPQDQENIRILRDMMSAITCVIDTEIINKGGRV